MSRTITLIFVAFLVAVIVGDSPPQQYPNRPGYCRIKDVYIKEGETGPAPLGECSRITCKSATPGQVGISGVGCGTFVPAKGCHLSDYDYTKPYPHCCPQSICEDKSGN